MLPLSTLGPPWGQLRDKARLEERAGLGAESRQQSQGRELYSPQNLTPALVALDLRPYPSGETERRSVEPFPSH